MADKNRKSDTFDKAREQTDKMKEMAQERMQQAKEKMDAARQQLNETKEQISEYVSANPVKSVLIAAGIGVLLGSLWASSRTRR